MTFLTDNNFNLDALDCPQLLTTFIDEMERGLAGQGALPMLPSGIFLKNLSPRNITVPAFDVGGTNTRATRITFDAEGVPTFSSIQRGVMPGSQGEVNASTFYNQLCDTLCPTIANNERIGFCFSYPIDETGTLLFWTKKIQAAEVAGRNIVADLLVYLQQRGYTGCSLRILNDTVAALLATYTHPEATTAAGCVGFILGTGTNTAYAEKTSAIRKAPHLPQTEVMPINCESGNFNRFPKSTFDRIYDAQTKDEHAQWERCISGVHLGSLGSIMLRTAAEQGLLPSARDTLLSKDFTHVDLNRFCCGECPELIPCSSSDNETIRSLLIPLYERAARFAAINIAAAGIRSARANRKTSGTIIVNADGSTFWKTSAIPFAERVTQTVETLLRPYHYNCQIIRVNEAPLLGAAIAALN